MKISIITVVYNNEKYIEESIQSIISQDYDNIEHIIIDGGSTDNTVNIIKKYKDNISLLISEKDKGIYDAMNKGLKSATGDIVGILNSDDIFIDANVIKKVDNIFKTKNVDCIYADVLYVDKDNTDKVIRKWISSDFIPGSFKKGWHPPHTTFFVKKSIYEKYGYIDDSLDVSADFELMLRFLEKHKVSTYYLNEVIIKMRIGGESNKSIFKILKGNINCYKAFKKNGLKVSPIYFLYRLVPKIGQYFHS